MRFFVKHLKHSYLKNGGKFFYEIFSVCSHYLYPCAERLKVRDFVIAGGGVGVCFDGPRSTPPSGGTMQHRRAMFDARISREACLKNLPNLGSVPFYTFPPQPLQKQTFAIFSIFTGLPTHIPLLIGDPCTCSESAVRA